MYVNLFPITWNTLSAIGTTAVAIIAIIPIIRDRPNIKIDLEDIFILDENKEESLIFDHFHIVITNVGRRRIIIQGWAGQFKKKKNREWKEIIRMTGLRNIPEGSISLEEGQSYTIEENYEVAKILENANNLYIKDSTGKKWVMKKKKFNKNKKRYLDLKNKGLVPQK